jgi:hypothetical protein
MASFGGTIHHDELLWLYRLPLDVALVGQFIPPFYDRDFLCNVVRSLWFKTCARFTTDFDWLKLFRSAVFFLSPLPVTAPLPAFDSLSIDQPTAETIYLLFPPLRIILKITGELFDCRICSQAPENSTTDLAPKN